MVAKRLTLLLLDTDVVIHLHYLGLWDRVVAACDVHLAETVVREAQFWEDDAGERHYIELSGQTAHGGIRTFGVTRADLNGFLTRFDPSYLERLDPGETESLAFLLTHVAQPFLLCSSDKIVFKVLGALNMADSGISVEEVLQRIGLARRLPNPLTKAYREQHTLGGFSDAMRERGLRPPQNNQGGDEKGSAGWL